MIGKVIFIILAAIFVLPVWSSRDYPYMERPEKSTVQKVRTCSPGTGSGSLRSRGRTSRRSWSFQCRDSSRRSFALQNQYIYVTQLATVTLKGKIKQNKYCIRGPTLQTTFHLCIPKKDCDIYDAEEKDKQCKLALL